MFSFWRRKSRNIQTATEMEVEYCLGRLLGQNWSFSMYPLTWDLPDDARFWTCFCGDSVLAICHAGDELIGPYLGRTETAAMKRAYVAAHASRDAISIWLKECHT